MQLYGLGKKLLRTPLDTKVIKIYFSKKCSAKNLTLSDAENNISGPSNRGSKAGLLLLTTLLALHQN